MYYLQYYNIKRKNRKMSLTSAGTFMNNTINLYYALLFTDQNILPPKGSSTHFSS